MSCKKFLLTTALITLCCILSSCGNLLPVDSSSNKPSASNNELNTDSDSLADVTPDENLLASTPDETLSLSSLILPDFLSITVNGDGVTSLLQDSEIDDFLNIVENIQFSVATDDVDISTPGAISCTISIEYGDGDGDIQEITLPYFLHNGILYVTDANSLLLLSSFLDSNYT